MGREATKARDNVYYRARIDAAKYNDRLSSREGAAEYLGMSSSNLASIELGLMKQIPPDNVVLMADLYGAPWLQNWYCKNQCPICREELCEEICGLDRLTVKMFKNLKVGDLEAVKEKWVDIAADGEITEDEMDHANEVLEYLAGVREIIGEIELLVKSKEVEYGRSAKEP